MSNSLKDLLMARDYDEPAEVRIIKDFVHKHYQSDCAVTMHNAQIIIVVKGASLAGALRMRLHELQALCQTQKRLIIRIN